MDRAATVTVHAPLGRRAMPVAVMAVGAVVAIVGALLPWLRTGGRARNSFDLFRLVADLGFAPDGPAAMAIRWWPLVPLLAVVAVVAAWWGWPRAGGALGLVSAAYALTVALAVLSATTRGRGLARAPGVAVTVAGAAVLAAGSIAVLVVRPTTGRAGPARPRGPPAGRS